MAYTKRAVVAYYNCDESGKMKISAALREMQQVGTDHLNFIGYTYERLVEEKMVFLLSKTIAEVNRMPVADEKILVQTVPTKSKGARFIREVVILDTEENPLVYFRTFWVLVEPESRKILRPAAFPYELPFKESLLDGHAEDEKFAKFDSEKPFTTVDIPVSYSIMDNNGHVNNSSYIDLICDLIPYDVLVSKGISKMMISYQNEARYGDMVTISGYNSDENQYNFVGKKENGNCFEAQIILKS